MTSWTIKIAIIETLSSFSAMAPRIHIFLIYFRNPFLHFSRGRMSSKFLVLHYDRVDEFIKAWILFDPKQSD